MRINHAFLRRTLLCLGACLALLGYIPVAHAIKKADLGKFGFNTNGNSIQVGAAQAGKSWQSTGNVGQVPVGHVGSQVGQSGWWVGAGGAANPANGVKPSMNMNHDGDVFFSGTKYPFQAAYKVEPKDLLSGLVGLCSTPITCAAAIAGTYALGEWLDGAKVSLNPNPADYPDRPFSRQVEKEGYACQPETNYAGTPAIGSTSHLGCGGFGAGSVFLDFVAASNGVGGVCKVRNSCHSTVIYAEWGTTRSATISYLPQSMSDIEPYMDARPLSPDIARELLDRGANIPLGSPTVTGPASLPSSTTTTTNNNTTTTTTTTNKFTTNGDTITKTSTSTVVNTCTGGSCNSSSTDVVEEPEGEDCEKNPNSLACSELDTPEGEIPKSNKDLTYTEDAMFSGGGSCPADKYMTVHTGQQLKVWDWQQSCSWIVSYVRPVLLVIAAYIALMILVPQT